MADLDGDLGSLDSLDVLGMTDATPVAMDESRAAAEAVELPYPIDDIRSVVVCGMGGSAIAADLVAGTYVERLRVPLVVVRDYVLPGWVDEHTLVILSSYSGTTEETLTCAMQATERGTRCLAITSGGKLQERYVEEDGIPMVPIPLGLQPRAALPRSLVPLLVILSRIGVLGDVVADLDEGRETAAASVAGLSASVPTSENPAKQLARALVDSIPVFWGGQMTAPVAHRWRTQVNENAKRFAISSELPELDHNEICGFEGLGELDRRMQDRSAPGSTAHTPGGTPPGPHSGAGHSACRRCSCGDGRRNLAAGEDARSRPARRLRLHLPRATQGHGSGSSRDDRAAEREAGGDTPWPGARGFHRLAVGCNAGYRLPSARGADRGRRRCRWRWAPTRPGSVGCLLRRGPRLSAGSSSGAAPRRPTGGASRAGRLASSGSDPACTGRRP